MADIIRQRKDDFYEEYYYLKPECEKNGWDKFCDGLASVGEWCKEHWKLIVATVIVIAAVVVIVFFPAAAPVLLFAAKGAIFGAVSGGLLGGLTSLLSGGSFLGEFRRRYIFGCFKWRDIWRDFWSRSDVWRFISKCLLCRIFFTVYFKLYIIYLI